MFFFFKIVLNLLNFCRLCLYFLGLLRFLLSYPLPLIVFIQVIRHLRLLERTFISLHVELLELSGLFLVLLLLLCELRFELLLLLLVLGYALLDGGVELALGVDVAGLELFDLVELLLALGFGLLESLRHLRLRALALLDEVLAALLVRDLLRLELVDGKLGRHLLGPELRDVLFGAFVVVGSFPPLLELLLVLGVEAEGVVELLGAEGGQCLHLGPALLLLLEHDLVEGDVVAGGERVRSELVLQLVYLPLLDLVDHALHLALPDAHPLGLGAANLLRHRDLALSLLELDHALGVRIEVHFHHAEVALVEGHVLHIGDT